MQPKAVIVLADDEPLIRRAYKDGLERLDFSVYVAADGQETLELVKKYQPDLVLLDLLMPKKDGRQVLTEIKSDPILSKTKVIILSNFSQTTDETEVKKLGALDFVIKSDHSIKEVAAKVQSYLG